MKPAEIAAMKAATEERGRIHLPWGSQVANSILNLVNRILVPADRRPTATQMMQQALQVLSSLS